jgi:ubiquinone/menaquinone biosynthesis C-methylase UbiE
MMARQQTATAYSEITIGGGDTAQPINLEARLALIQRHVPLAGRKTIDCGCGSGGYILELLKLGSDAWGVEHNEEKVRHFKQTAKEPDLVKVGDLERIEFRDATFDIALLNEVLEHVPSDQKALTEICRILKPAGTLMIFSPNRLYPFETHGVSCKSTGYRVLPYFTLFVPYLPVRVGKRFLDYHARNYFPSELKRIVSEAGFEVTYRTYMWQTFENISGSQPKLLRALSPLLRQISFALKRIPLLRALSVSQVIFANKR